MNLVTTTTGSSAMAIIGALAGALVAPAAAAATVTVPGGQWPWQSGSGRWLLGEPATRRRRALVVVAGVVVLGSLAAVIGGRPAALGFIGMGLIGVILFVIDLEHHRLPDRLTGSAAIASGAALLLDAVVTGSWPALIRGLLCAVVALTVFLAMALISPRGMGLGDVKLAGLLSLHTGWLGWQLAVVSLLAGFVLGGLAALVLVAARRVGMQTAIPFGPALLVGAWLSVLASATPAASA